MKMRPKNQRMQDSLAENSIKAPPKFIWRGASMTFPLSLSDWLAEQASYCRIKAQSANVERYNWLEDEKYFNRMAAIEQCVDTLEMILPFAAKHAHKDVYEKAYTTLDAAKKARG